MQHRSSETILDLTPPAASLRIAYGGEPEQFGDLWLPEIVESRRLVVFIHGGYWRARYDLAHVNFACQALAEQGMVVWNVEYRRVGNRGGGWPGTFDDVLSALDYGGQKVATALNGDFVSERQRALTRVASGDRIEVLSARQGG